MTEQMEDDVFEGITVELRILFENSPNRKDMSTGEIERRALIETPSIRRLVAVLSGVRDR